MKNDNILDDKFSSLLANPAYGKFIYFAALDEVEHSLIQSDFQSISLIQKAQLILTKMLTLAKSPE